VAACLTAGDDDGVRATCDEASDDGREAATSGGDAGDGGDDGSDEPLRRWKKSKNKSRSVRGWKGKRRRAGRGAWRWWAGGDAGPSTVGRCASGTLYPTGRRLDGHMGYSHSEFFFDLCVNVLVRPTRISPRQSGAAGPCSTLRGCTARPGSSVTYTAVSSADRAESLGL
jgi:hypothetical protein